jgi:hypothetical protein
MIDETGYGDGKPRKKMGIRTAVMASLDTAWWALRIKRDCPANRIANLGMMLRWGMLYGMCGRSKRRKSVNVDELVGKWIETIVTMSTAHDKDAYDAADATADTLLGPLLTASVKQVREFYVKLQERLQADPHVPMLVWMGFDAWGEVMVKDAPDEGIKRLKNKLAAEIADLVEEDIRDQIPKAIARALRWRDPKTLKAVKATIESGVKPKLRGRESCLFLEAGRGKRKVSVML